MSLKAFHIAFVALSTLLCVGFGLWALRRYLEAGTLGYLATTAGSLVLAAGLVAYGVWFLRKLRHVSFL